jgi:hypothetical protein
MSDGLVTHKIGDNVYECYRWTFTVACAARGPAALMAVASAADGDGEGVAFEDMDARQFAERLSIMRKDLAAVMVKPRLVEQYTGKADEVTWQQMGDDFGKLHQRVTSGESESVANFPESSEGQTE